MSNPSHAVQASVDALQAYLIASVPGLAVLNEWPAANQKLSYPSVTVTAGQVKTMNRAPEQIATTTPDPRTFQVVATEVIGEHDFKLQLDLWTANKVDRNKYLGLLFNAINAAAVDASGKNKPLGLSLQLPDYFNDWVRFDIDGHVLMDDVAAAERQERRAKVDVLVNCRAIQLRTYYAMVNIETNVGATPSQAGMAPNTTNTDQSIV